MNRTVITKTLKELGISPSLYGYTYLTDAIELVIQDETLIRRRVTKELYPTIAKRYKSKWTHVERNIRHCIEVAYNRGNIDLLYDVFGYSIDARKGKATNSEFIATIAEYLKERENDQRKAD